MDSRDREILRVEVRFKNARLYDAILEHAIPIFGEKSAAGAAARARGRIRAFCRFYGFHSTHVYDLLNLRKGPLAKQAGGMRLREICQQLSGILEKDPEWLFPPRLYEATWRPIAGYLSDARVQQLLSGSEYTEPARLPPAADDVVCAGELTGAITRALGDLSPRDRRVLEMRFGLDGNGERSLDEVGDALQVTRERIRQIEARGLRQLRHPARSRRLRPFTDIIGVDANRED